MKEKIAIIGANEAITILINKAKSMGYETHVFAWACGDPGETVADFFYPISIDDKEKILDKCRMLGVKGVCSITSDYAAPTVSYIARKLGLPANPERTDTVARNKFEMRCAFQREGLYTPKYYLVGEDFSSKELHDIKYPVIVKPTDRWSSKGVTRVDVPEKLSEAVKYAVSESLNKKAIVEEFMNGPEYSAECICFNGERRVLTYTRKETTDYPHYIETGHMQPANIDKVELVKIEGTIMRALQALEIENGAAHVEFRILENGEVGIIEVGARMGGDYIGTDLTPVSTGMDYVRMVVDVACGKSPYLEKVSKPCPVAVKFILNSKDIEQFYKLKELYPDRIIRVSKFDTDYSKEVVDSSTRHGYYIYRLEE